MQHWNKHAHLRQGKEFRYEVPWQTLSFLSRKEMEEVHVVFKKSSCILGLKKKGGAGGENPLLRMNQEHASVLLCSTISLQATLFTHILPFLCVCVSLEDKAVAIVFHNGEICLSASVPKVADVKIGH